MNLCVCVDGDGRDFNTVLCGSLCLFMLFLNSFVIFKYFSVFVLYSYFNVFCCVFTVLLLLVYLLYQLCAVLWKQSLFMKCAI